MFSCVQKKKNWCFIIPLCDDCKQIRQLGNLYSMEKIHDILNRVLLREDKAVVHRTESSKKIQEVVSEIKATKKIEDVTPLLNKTRAQQKKNIKN